MLDTNLKHVTTKEEFDQLLSENENVMICCGRMGPMCLPVYAVMEKLEPKYPHVAFRDMAFDSPASTVIRGLPETRYFNSLPFTVYYRNGKLVKATSGIQNKQQVVDVLRGVFAEDSSVPAQAAQAGA
jgi:thioredoxin 1